MIYFWIALAALVALSAGLNIRKRGFGKYAIGVLIGIDQVGNAILGGDPKMTISARCERGYGKRWYWTVLGRLLLAIDPDHIKH